MRKLASAHFPAKLRAESVVQTKAKADCYADILNQTKAVGCWEEPIFSDASSYTQTQTVNYLPSYATGTPHTDISLCVTTKQQDNIRETNRREQGDLFFVMLTLEQNWYTVV